MCEGRRSRHSELTAGLGAAPIIRCYTDLMPTVRPRHTITVTPEIARALDDAALVWPEFRDDRAALLRKLIGEGHDATKRIADAEDSERMRAIRSNAGVLAGAYPSGAVESLKAEWPE